MALPANKKSLTISVSKELYERIQKIAEKERRSMSFICNEVLEQNLEKTFKEK